MSFFMPVIACYKGILQNTLLMTYQEVS